MKATNTVSAIIKLAKLHINSLRYIEKAIPNVKSF